MQAWLKATDLPRGGDAAGKRSFWAQVKQGVFRKVGTVIVTGWLAAAARRRRRRARARSHYKY